MPTVEPDPLYHLALADDWAAALAEGTYRVSTLGRSLDDVGFIHCSFRDQVQHIADLVYRGRDDVLVLEVDPSRLDPEVVVEAVGGVERFPHVHGPLDVDAVARVVPLADVEARPMDRVETDRLLLRRWRAHDLDELVRVFAKPEVWWWPSGRGWTEEETEAFLDRKLAEWDQRGWSQWAAVEKGTGMLMGFIGLCPPAFLPEVMPTVEVGWRLDPSFWGRGYATEGGRASIAAGFDVLGLDEIVSIYEPENVASGRVMERLHMIHDRDTTHPERKIPLRVYKVTREQWNDST